MILVDTREQTNSHILDYFDKQGIAYQKKALKTGDYSLMIAQCDELGFLRDTYLVDELCIERKNSVDELAGNLAERDDRILKEFNRMINIPNCYICIENSSFDDIIKGNYKSKYNSDSYLRTILTLQKRCGFNLYFIQPNNMGKVIYEICKNCLDSKILK